jgi:hypothetical protein
MLLLKYAWVVSPLSVVRLQTLLLNLQIIIARVRNDIPQNFIEYIRYLYSFMMFFADFNGLTSYRLQ